MEELYPNPNETALHRQIYAYYIKEDKLSDQ